MANMSLGGTPLKVNPEEIRWNFKMKTRDYKTLGGKVIQVIGATLGDITIQGAHGRGDRSKGDIEGWQGEVRFIRQVEKWADRAANTNNTDPLRFTYAPRGWDFQVFVKSISGIDHTQENFNPRWTMVLFPVDDRSRAIVDGIKDLYLKRLMDGVGWKQTAYNGPTQQEVDDSLAGGSVEQYLAEGYSSAFAGGVGSSSTPFIGPTIPGAP